MRKVIVGGPVAVALPASSAVAPMAQAAMRAMRVRSIGILIPWVGPFLVDDGRGRLLEGRPAA